MSVEANLPIISESMQKNEFSDVWQLCQVAHRAGIIPKQLDTAEKLYLAICFLRSLGVEPLTNLANIAIINGVPSVCRDLPLLLARRHPEWDESRFREVILYDDHGVPIGAECQVARKGCEPVVRRFTRDDALRAKLLSKPGPWQEYPGRMYQCRARAWALRDAFTDALAGCVIHEEMIGVEVK